MPAKPRSDKHAVRRKAAPRRKGYQAGGVVGGAPGTEQYQPGTSADAFSAYDPGAGARFFAPADVRAKYQAQIDADRAKNTGKVKGGKVKAVLRRGRK